MYTDLINANIFQEIIN